MGLKTEEIQVRNKSMDDISIKISIRLIQIPQGLPVTPPEALDESFTNKTHISSLEDGIK